MSDFTFHTIENTRGEAHELLSNVKERYGFVPNLFAYMAEAPVTIKAYTQLNDLLEETSFTPLDRQYALLAISALSECDFCTAAHGGMATMFKGDEEVIRAIVTNQAIANPAVAALVRTARAVVEKRGWTDEADLKAFYDAGYTQQQYLELILIVTIKTLSNYTNHQTKPAVNPEFL